MRILESLCRPRYNFTGMQDGLQNERDLGMFFDIVLMSKCTQVWVFGEHLSAGMRIEIDKARCKEYTVRYFRSDCVER